MAETIRTTDATVTTLATIDFAKMGPPPRAWTIDVSVTGVATDGSVGMFIRRVSVKYNGPTTLAAIGAVTAMLSAKDVAAWDVTLTLSGDTILVRVNGDAGRTVNWIVTSTAGVAGVNMGVLS
jgi:hypothetical protein